MISAADIIDRLKLQPHPEGGFYAETYRSEEELACRALPCRYGANRSVATAIYFLLTADSCSVMHRLKSDEIFHFYLGDPVTMLHLYPDGQTRIVTLGPDLLQGHQPQIIVPKNIWQGSFTTGSNGYALLGTTVAPGFDFADFEYGDRQNLITQYPDQAQIITRLTRE